MPGTGHIEKSCRPRVRFVLDHLNEITHAITGVPLRAANLDYPRKLFGALECRLLGTAEVRNP